jgi:hypothetical protein
MDNLIHKNWSIEKVLSSNQTCTVQNMSNTELEVSLFPLKYAIACIEIDFFIFDSFFSFVLGRGRCRGRYRPRQGA